MHHAQYRSDTEIQHSRRRPDGLIQENAARAVRRDLENYFAALAPEDPSRYD
jgi:hypothetical protein